MDQRSVRLGSRRPRELKSHCEACSGNDVPPRNLEVSIYLPSGRRERLDDERWDVRLDPFLRRGDVPPHDEGPREGPEEEEVGTDVVESSSRIWDLEDVGDILPLRTKEHESNSDRRS